MAQPAPVILLAFANDKTGDYLSALEYEQAQIKEALQEAEQAGDCEVICLEEATAHKVIESFQSKELRDRIAVLHFAGHAKEGWALLMETPSGGTALVQGEALADFLRCQPELSLVFLNGCNTLELAKHLLDYGAAAVIGTSDPNLDDRRAAYFAAAFYRALAGHRTLDEAFQESCAALRVVNPTLEASGRGVGYSPDLDPAPSLEPQGYDAGQHSQPSQAALAPPWHLEPRLGAKEHLDWHLRENNPLRHLPLPKDIPLPPVPFHLGLLQGYDRQHAPAFFGRHASIRQLYDQLTGSDTKPIVLFYGQSGVGKSSVLAAGLLPRIETSHALAYLRRPPQTGLLEALIEAIGGGASLTEAWHAREARDNKPLLVVMDQTEELLQSPQSGYNAWQTLLAEMESLFQTPEHWPQGKLLLGLHQEWLELMQRDMKKHCLPAELAEILDPLDRQAILEIFQNIASKYDLQLSPEDLPERIAMDLLEIQEELIGSTLQILLSQLLWNTEAKRPLNSAYIDGELISSKPMSISYNIERRLQLSKIYPANDTPDTSTKNSICRFEITIDKYLRIGGINGSVEKHSDNFIFHLKKTEKEFISFILVHLVKISAHGLIRRKFKKRFLSGNQILNGFAQKMVDSRLAINTYDAMSREPTIELAYDCILFGNGIISEEINNYKYLFDKMYALEMSAESWKTKGNYKNNYLIQEFSEILYYEWLFNLYLGDVDNAIEVFLQESRINVKSIAFEKVFRPLFACFVIIFAIFLGGGYFGLLLAQYVVLCCPIPILFIHGTKRLPFLLNLHNDLLFIYFYPLLNFAVTPCFIAFSSHQVSFSILNVIISMMTLIPCAIWGPEIKSSIIAYIDDVPSVDKKLSSMLKKSSPVYGFGVFLLILGIAFFVASYMGCIEKTNCYIDDFSNVQTFISNLKKVVI